MTAESPYEIDHVPPRLHADFDGRVPPAQKGDAGERERNFLSRALAAFAVHKLAGSTLDDAAKSVVDAGQDGGIDAVYHSPTANALWVVQSKFFADGQGEPALGDVSKFRDGIENLNRGNWAAFEKNEHWRGILPAVKRHMDDPSLKVRAVLVYSGVHAVSQDRLWMFEELGRKLNQTGDNFEFKWYGLTSVHDWITGADKPAGVPRVEIDILNPGWVSGPYKTVYGQVRASDVAALYAAHGGKLIDANIRRYKGLTEVNERISETLQSEPQHFFYLNNGLTAYCKKLDVAPLDRTNTDKKKVIATEFSIVNGAQTLGSIHAAAVPADTAGFVFLKVISLERCDEDVKFARRITESTNFQNQIGPRDFVSLDDQHERIATQLQMDGIRYHYKEADDVPASDDANFTLDDAATALACLEQHGDCRLYALLVANRRALWAQSPAYPADNPTQTWCERLFPKERSARTIWRAVQTQKIVLDRLRDEMRTASGVRKAFFTDVRWIVLNLVFLREKLDQGGTLSLSVDEKARAASRALEFAEVVWTVAHEAGFVSSSGSGGDAFQVAKSFRSVFCNAEDCRKLRSGALAKLNAPGTRPAGGGGANT